MARGPCILRAGEVFAEVNEGGTQTPLLALLQEKKEGLVPGIGLKLWK